MSQHEEQYFQDTIVVYECKENWITWFVLGLVKVTVEIWSSRTGRRKAASYWDESSQKKLMGEKILLDLFKRKGYLDEE